MKLLRRLIIISWLCFIMLQFPKWVKVDTNTPVEAKNATETIVEVAEAKEPASGIVQEDLFVKYFGDQANTMRAICQAESGLDPNAVGDTNTKYPSVGLCQIRLLPERQITMEQMKIPEENIKYARLLYDKYGFKPWTMWKNGVWKKYL